MLQSGYFADRILPFDSYAAVSFGSIRASREGIGRPISIEDGQIVCPRHGARFKALIPVTLVWLFAEGIMAYCHVGPWKS